MFVFVVERAGPNSPNDTREITKYCKLPNGNVPLRQFSRIYSRRCRGVCNKHTWGRLDLAVPFTPSTPNRRDRNQVRWNICAGVRRSTPSYEVVQTEQSRDLFKKRWRITACMRGNILYRLIYSGVLRSAQFYLFMWLFWRTPSTLKIAKSSPPPVYFTGTLLWRINLD